LGDIGYAIGDALSAPAEIGAGQYRGAIAAEQMNQKIRESQERLQQEREYGQGELTYKTAQLDRLLHPEREDARQLEFRKAAARAAGFKEGSPEWNDYVYGLKQSKADKPDDLTKFNSDFERMFGHKPTQKDYLDFYLPKANKGEGGDAAKPSGNLGYALRQGLITPKQYVDSLLHENKPDPGANRPLSGEAQKNLEKVEGTIAIGGKLLEYLDDYIVKEKDPNKRQALNSIVAAAMQESGVEKTLAMLRAKAEASLYFGGHIPDDYSRIITQAEQFTLRATPLLTGSRAARYNLIAMRHLPQSHGDSPVFMREKLMQALDNLGSERDSTISAARTPRSAYALSTELPPPTAPIPKDGKVHTVEVNTDGKLSVIKVRWDAHRNIFEQAY